MTTIELLKEVLKDPILREKYNIPESVIQNVTFDKESEYKIIETLKEIIRLKNQNIPDTQVYKSIKMKFDI